MRYGSPWGSGYGDPQNHLLWNYPDMAMALRVAYTYIPWHFKFRSGWGNAFLVVWVNDKKYGTYYVAEGEDFVARIAPPPGGGSLNLCAIRVGQLSDPSWDNPLIPKAYDTLSPRVTLNWTWTPEIIQPALSGGGHLSNWVLAGQIYGETCAPVAGHKTWGRMTFTVTVAGGIATVTVNNGGTVVATGSGAVSSTIALTGLLTGSVDIDGSAVDVTDGILDTRWPVSMKIYRDATSPPGTLVATVRCNNQTTGKWTEKTNLTTGTYYYQGFEYSDTGEIGTGTSILNFTILGAPAPPLTLAYVSGNAAATILTFKNSLTAGATYNVYAAAAIGTPADMSTPLMTVTSGTPSAAHNFTLPAITGYAGILPVLVRATNGGIEEQNLSVLLIEYDAAGNVIVARPNTPGISSYTITAGWQLNVQGLYDSNNEKTAATALRLYVRTPSGSYSTYAAQTTLAGLSGTLKQCQLINVFSSDGYYYVKLTAVDAAGVEDNPTTVQETLIEVSDNAMAAAGDFSGEVARD